MWSRLVSVGVLGIAFGGVAVWFALQEGDESANSEPITRKVHELSTDQPSVVPAHRPSLAEIVLNAHDFQRHTSLFALLADTGPGEVEALLAEVGTLAPTPHRYDVARVIYTRFAEIDPETAADHVVSSNYHPSWVVAVFRAWAHLDLDAAVQGAAALEDGAKAIAAGAILGLDLPDGRREDIARQLDSELALAAINAREALATADNDFAAAWQSALGGVDLARRQTLNDMEGMHSTLTQLALLARRWASHDPAAAMTEIGRVDNRMVDTLLRPAFQVWVADDPSGAMAWLAESGRRWERDMLANTLMGELVNDGLAEAILTLDTMPSDLRDRARISLVTAFRNRDTSDLDFQMVLDWYDALASPGGHLGGELARTYASRDPEQAFAWVQTLTGRAQRDAVVAAVSQLARSDPALTKRLIAEIEDARFRQSAARQFISTAARSDPRGTLQWARSFPAEGDRPQLVHRALSTWSRVSPREAALEVLEMRDAELRDEVAATIAWPVAGGGHPELAEDLFETVESEDARRRVAAYLLRYYTAVEPDEDKAEFYRSIAHE